MRAFALSALLLVSAAASAQPVAAPYQVGAELASLPPAGSAAPAYRAAVTTTVGALGSALGAGAPVLVYVVARSPGLGSGDSGGGFPTGLAVLMAAGATAGTAAAVYAFGTDPADYRGLIPYPDLRKGDWRPALAGAALALLPGLGAALLIQHVLPPDADPFLTYLAVPVVQGLGASVAVQLSR